MDLFSTNITEEEKEYGFILAEVDNPNAKYMGQPKKVKAVVKILDTITRIVKHPYPPNSIMYSVQREITDHVDRKVWENITMPFPSLKALKIAGFL